MFAFREFSFGPDITLLEFGIGNITIFYIITDPRGSWIDHATRHRCGESRLHSPSKRRLARPRRAPARARSSAVRRGSASCYVYSNSMIERIRLQKIKLQKCENIRRNSAEFLGSER